MTLRCKKINKWTCVGLTPAAHWRLPFFLMVVALTAQAWAGPDMQSHKEIASAASAFIASELGANYPQHRITIGSIDPRLRLPSCARQLRAFLPPGGRLPGNTTIGVTCESDSPWTLYVSATVKVQTEIAVLKNPLARGAIITAQDVGLEPRELNGNETYMRNPAQVIGKVAKRTLAPGAALTPSMLAAPLLIRRGQEVVIVANTPGIDVRSQGIALSDGGAGDRIQVRNSLSKRVVEGTVLEVGIVQVTM